jgi:pyridoxine/pyridoxamine 5'-phosphate oxidase
MTSTGGTRPFARTRFGRKLVMKPSTFGRWRVTSKSIVFWPGLTVIGPNRKCRRWTP